MVFTQYCRTHNVNKMFILLLQENICQLNYDIVKYNAVKKHLENKQADFVIDKKMLLHIHVTFDNVDVMLKEINLMCFRRSEGVGIKYKLTSDKLCNVMATSYHNEIFLSLFILEKICDKLKTQGKYYNPIRYLKIYNND